MDGELLLLCHGATKDNAELTTQAKRQAQKFGNWLREQGLRPATTLATPECCAQVSAQKALKAAGWSAQDIVTDAALGAFGPGRVLISGSAERLAALVDRLAPGGPSPVPGTLVRLSRTGGPAQLIAADDLPDGFPYPGSTVRRLRPAYYYTQSAALPYRMRGGVPEILLITSSSGRRWGVPKGICEPGLTPQASAAQEALEEAGVAGRMQDASIGSFEVAKWGAVCTVAVFPMAVTRELPEAQREERHRQRAWLTQPEAAGRVTSLELGRLIAGWAL